MHFQCKWVWKTFTHRGNFLVFALMHSCHSLTLTSCPGQWNLNYGWYWNQIMTWIPWNIVMIQWHRTQSWWIQLAKWQHLRGGDKSQLENHYALVLQGPRESWMHRVQIYSNTRREITFKDYVMWNRWQFLLCFPHFTQISHFPPENWPNNHRADRNQQQKIYNDKILWAEITSKIVYCRAWNYKRKYLSMDRFDNTYISPLIEQIDRKRYRQEKQTILPLTFKEEFKYFKISKTFIVYFTKD